MHIGIYVHVSCVQQRRITVFVSGLTCAAANVVLAAPKLAAKQASEVTKSQRADAEAAIVRAVQDCLHFTGALRPLMPVLAEGPALEVAEQLLKLFVLAQPLLSQHAASCLQQLAQGAANTGNVDADKIQLLLQVRLCAVMVLLFLLCCCSNVYSCSRVSETARAVGLTHINLCLAGNFAPAGCPARPRHNAQAHRIC